MLSAIIIQESWKLFCSTSKWLKKNRTLEDRIYFHKHQHLCKLNSASMWISKHVGVEVKTMGGDKYLYWSQNESGEAWGLSIIILLFPPLQISQALIFPTEGDNETEEEMKVGNTEQLSTAANSFSTLPVELDHFFTITYSKPSKRLLVLLLISILGSWFCFWRGHR